MNYWKNIGANMRVLRKSKGLTIEDMAYVIGIAPGFLGLVERGTRGVSIANLVKISSFFGVSLEELAKGKVEREPFKGDKKALEEKAVDLAYTLTDEEMKITISNLKKVIALNRAEKTE